jgi:hypothetical protein
VLLIIATGARELGGVLWFEYLLQGVLQATDRTRILLVKSRLSIFRVCGWLRYSAVAGVGLEESWRRSGGIRRASSPLSSKLSIPASILWQYISALALLMLLDFVD